MSTAVSDIFPAMRQVKLDNVERELDQLWREHTAASGGPSGRGMTRNSVLTLVAYTETLEQATKVLALTHALSTQNSSRVIVITADPRSSANTMESYVGTFAASGTESFAEDILIVSRGNTSQHLPGVVLPFIISGLPSFLWWIGEPPWGSELFEALVDGCDRLITDTSDFTHVPEGFAALADLIRRKKTRCAVSDTGWTCQTPWREIVAQFFDPAAARKYLDGIEQVSIEYAAGEEDMPANPAEAYLIAGWLISRLGWRMNGTPAQLGAPSAHITVHAGTGRAISIEINPRYGINQRAWWENGFNADLRADHDGHNAATPPAVRHGALMSVHISARLNGSRATFTMARERDLAHASTLCQLPEGGAPPSQTVHLQSIGEEAPLTQQLQRVGHDAILEEAINAAAELMGTRGLRVRR